MILSYTPNPLKWIADKESIYHILGMFGSFKYQNPVCFIFLLKYLAVFYAILDYSMLIVGIEYLQSKDKNENYVLLPNSKLYVFVDF